MARAKNVAAVPREPTVVQRAARAILRWASWMFIAWFGFFIVRVGVHSLRTHAPFPWLGVVFSGPMDALEVAAAATAICMMAIIPYAYVVWPQPHRRFWGEGVPWYRVALGALSLGVVVGLVWGFTARIR